MDLIIDAGGSIRCLYDETLPLAELGALNITRASHVEPDPAGDWWADLQPSQGPVLGPFAQRSQALDAERLWLAEHWLLRSH